MFTIAHIELDGKPMKKKWKIMVTLIYIYIDILFTLCTKSSLFHQKKVFIFFSSQKKILHIFHSMLFLIEHH